MDEPAQLSAIVDIIRNVISILAPIAGIAFFFVLLIGGFQLVTSGGDPKAAASAKNTLTYAVIGIILVVASWLIITAIADFTGVDVTRVEFDTGSQITNQTDILKVR